MPILKTDKQDYLIDFRTGDLDFTGGRLSYSGGITGFAQGALIRVKQIKGEWFLNRRKGVAYYVVTGVVAPAEALLGQKFNRVKFEAALRDVLEQSPGVVQVLMLECTEDRKLRKVSSRWQLRTELGDTPVLTAVH
jgi:hypothetical protein